MTPYQIAQNALVDMGILVSERKGSITETIDFPDNAPQDLLVRARPHIETFERIETFDLSETQVADVTPLQGLTNLQQLDLSETQVADVTPLQGLTNLQWLYLLSTQVADVTPLQGLTNLEELFLDGTQVSEEDLARLRQILRETKISGP